MLGLKRTLVLLVALALAVVCAEIGFRWLGPKPYARPMILDADGNTVDLGQVIRFFRANDEHQVPAEPSNGIHPSFRARFCYDRPEWDFFDADGCVDVSINSLGFRDEEFPLEKPPGEHRVLAIGDSFTFAQGVPAELGWTEVLEDLLAERRGTPVQVMNAGFTGGGSWPQEYRPWVEAHALAFEPDVVVYGMCLNDMDRRVPMLAYTKVWDDPTVLGEPWLGGRSEILNFLQRKRRQRSFVESYPADFAALLRADPRHWQANQEALRAIHAHLSANGVRFVIAILPMLSLLGDEYPYAGLHDEVRAFCEAEGIEHVDLYPPFHELVDRELWVHPFDQHPNPAAHALFAEQIFEQLTP